MGKTDLKKDGYKWVAKENGLCYFRKSQGASGMTASRQPTTVRKAAFANKHTPQIADIDSLPTGDINAHLEYLGSEYDILEFFLVLPVEHPLVESGVREISGIQILAAAGLKMRPGVSALFEGPACDWQIAFRCKQP